ncbi:MAG: YkgJ family cysteine cluster protein [Gemmataceae bacterium]|nr:YkgJ family cysteine cluster protein [Gemmataceae bacterium]
MTADDNQPWYNAGLRFECTMCGRCCTGAPGFVWVSDEEVATIAEFLHEPLEQVTAMHTRIVERGRSLRESANGDCVFYDKQAGCTIYPARPAQCRTWPFWENNLATPMEWQHTCEVCPGSGQGDLIQVEEITRRLNVIRL